MLPSELDTIARLESTFWWYRGMNRLFLAQFERALDGLRPARMLDAGCGTGRMALLLGERFGARVHALDVEHKGLEYGRRLGLPCLVRGDVRGLPFGDGYFPALVSLDVLVHLAPGEEARALGEFARVLAPGGVFGLRVAALDALRSRHSEHIGEKQRFTRRQLRRLVEAAGLECVWCSYANALLLPLAFFKFRVWEPLTGAAPDSGIQALPPVVNRALEWFLRLEAWWLGAGGSFALGQSLVMFARKPGRAV